MKEIKEKINLSKNQIFQVSLILSGLLLTFSFFNMNKLQKSSTAITAYETRIEREKQDIKKAEAEIENIKAEFLNAEISHPLGMENRIPLIIRDIKKLISSKNLQAEIQPVNNGRRGSSTSFDIDPESGLRTITFDTKITYNRYSDVKELLVVLRESFPLTIDKLVFDSSGSIVTFTLYGN